MPTSQTFDLIVIGAGPGGYVCAFRAAQLGLKVALIDKRATLGGTCLNVGCIPSKALLASSEHFLFAQKHAAEHGIKIDGVSIDIAAMLKKKDGIVSKLTGGVAALAKARKVTVITGAAAFVSANTVAVGDQKLTATNIVIATGSAPVELPFMKFDGETVISSDHAISLPSVPKKLVVVGGGAIGLELGSVWARLGAEVTVVEFLPKIAATYDDDIVRNFTRLLQKQGLKIECGAKVTGFANGVLTAEREGKVLEFPADKVLVAVGRRPFADNLNLAAAGVALTDKKRIQVDSHLKTTAAGVWAIGDVIDGPMLAHKAEEEGIAAVETIAGYAGHVNYDAIPGVIYTFPEVASVGKTEEELQAANVQYNKGTFPFAANSRARANGTGNAEGFVKVLADKVTDKILGVHIMGPNAGEMIAEGVLGMEYGAASEDLARTCHAHPTLSEAFKEACMDAYDKPIHF